VENVNIEKSINKTYRKTIFRPFIEAIKEFELIKPNDKIAVCISGGKDSFLLAKCIQELQKHGQISFNAEYVVMDPGYQESNLQLIIENARRMNIPIQLFSTEIFDIVVSIERSPCYLCARMRRGHLYAKARELGCNKIVLGHHFDDVVETILMNMLYSGQIKTMLPKLHSKNFAGLELIRPLYLVKEEDIKQFWAFHKAVFLQCACRFTEQALNEQKVSKRKEMKQLLQQFRQSSPIIEQHIFRSVENVRLDTIVGYHKGEKYHSFLEDY